MTKDYRRHTIRYWERRRILFNAIILVMFLFTWPVSQAFTAGIDDKIPASLLDPFTVIAIGCSFLLCNVCYSIVYALEFIFYNEDAKSFWPTTGRALIFIAGCLVVLFTAGPHFSNLERQLADFP